MPSSNGHHEYDANLLLSAPAPTKGMLQSGYATDLLEDKPKPKPNRRDDLESGRHKSYSKNTSTSRATADSVEPKIASTTSIPAKDSSSPSAQKTPFYRSKKGIIIIAVLVAIVVLAAVIGGAVGGTRNKNTDASNPQQPFVSGSSSAKGSGDGQGKGATTTSTTVSVGSNIIPLPTSQPVGQPTS